MKILRTGLRLAVAVAILSLLLARMDLQKLLHVVHEAHWGGIVWGFVWITAAYLLLSLRWKVLLQTTQIRIPLVDLVKLTYLSHFIGYLLPGGVSIDAVRGVYLWRHTQGRRAQAMASILVDRLIGFWAIIALAFLGAWMEQQNAVLLPLAAVLGVFTVVWITAFLTPIVRVIDRLLYRFPHGEKLALFYDALHHFSRNPQALVASLGISLLFQFAYILAAHTVFQALSPTPPSVGATLAYVSLINALTMIPITIGGLGVREGGFVAAFAPMVGEEVAFAASLLYYAIGILGALPGGILWMLQKDTLRAYQTDFS